MEKNEGISASKKNAPHSKPAKAKDGWFGGDRSHVNMRYRTETRANLVAPLLEE